ncbi:MAG: GNAT family N-acetyltransferase [Bacilli bacterium]|nr:GNAT family N-acetyltransferase [Bacilli bacterium]
MFEFSEMDIFQKQSLKLNMADNIYVLKLDSKIIGYGKIIDDYNNRIEIYIEKNYRGNGYGKLLFGKMLEKVKTLNIRHIYVTLDKKNVQMIKILSYFNGKHVSTDDDTLKYIVPLKV